MPTLEELRVALAAKESKSTHYQTQQGPSQLFPFWNAAPNTTSTIRLLPDGDDQNEFFWRERQMITLSFADGVKTQVPCLEMWGEKCPILDQARIWFKDKGTENLGRRYWKKPSYLFQGLVVHSAVEEKEKPANPIRRFTFSKQLFGIIKAVLMDAEVTDLPIDYQKGRDFKITATVRGGFKDYSTSTFSMRERALSTDELKAIDENGLFNLKDFLPKKPDAELLNEMFKVSQDGGAWDESWSRIFVPSKKPTFPEASSIVESVGPVVVNSAKETLHARPNMTPAQILEQVKRKQVAKEGK